MKKFLQLAAVYLSIVVVAASCSAAYNATPSNASQNTTPTGLVGTFTASIDGTVFAADVKQATKQLTNGLTTLSIAGNMYSYDKNPANYQSIAFTIVGYKGPGTYRLVNDSIAGTYINVVSNTPTSYASNIFNSDTTQFVTVTGDQGNYTGTFNFSVGTNSGSFSWAHSISNGVFSVPN